jgi:hypothetical protein
LASTVCRNEPGALLRKLPPSLLGTPAEQRGAGAQAPCNVSKLRSAATIKLEVRTGELA